MEIIRHGIGLMSECVIAFAVEETNVLEEFNHAIVEEEDFNEDETDDAKTNEEDEKIDKSKPVENPIVF